MMKFKLNAVFFCVAAGMLLLHSLPAESSGEVSKLSGMVVDLGETSHYVKVTPDYTRAAVLAVLPYFSDVAEKLNLPISKPITQADILRSHVLPFRDLGVSLMLKSGWAFSYSLGHVNLVADAHGYSALQDPSQISHYYGEVKMTKEEAVQFARNALQKLGIPLEEVFAEQEPLVISPEKIGTNTVPHYEVRWLDPRGGSCVVIHVNANTKQVERLSLLSKNLERHYPKVSVAPASDPDWPSVNPEYARQLIPMMFKAIGDYAQKLSLPITLPLTTNNVARVEINDNEGWPHCEIFLTNGWRFIYRHTMVNGYYSPNAFVVTDKGRFRLKDFKGKWNLDTNAAIKLVKANLAKLNFPTNNIHMDFAPNIIYAAGDFKKIIPRYFFEWNYENATHDDLQSKVEAEVNADNGILESLYYDDKAYWGSRPPIDAPISFKGNGHN